MVDESSLVGYCGLYCGACAIYQQMIRKRGKQLLKVLDAYQLREIAKEAKEWDPKLVHYHQFEDVLRSLMKMFGECPGCLAGGGPPACVIRDCCKENGFSTCAECDNMPCDKLEPQIQGYRGHSAMLRRIKEIGTKKMGYGNGKESQRGIFLHRGHNRQQRLEPTVFPISHKN